MDSWKDPETLKSLYHGENMTTKEVGDKLGCNKGTIVYWMEKFGIDRRDKYDEYRKSRRSNPARYETYSRGYERWVCQIDGKKNTVRVHRLLAVAEYGFETLQNMDVHHKNHIPWDNRPENIEIIDRSDHSKLHNPKGSSPDERGYGAVKQ